MISQQVNDDADGGAQSPAPLQGGAPPVMWTLVYNPNN